MIKNLNETLSLLTLALIAFFSIKIGLGFIFSNHLTGTAKGNFELLKAYKDNEEE